MTHDYLSWKHPVTCKLLDCVMRMMSSLYSVKTISTLGALVESKCFAIIYLLVASLLGKRETPTEMIYFRKRINVTITTWSRGWRNVWASQVTCVVFAFAPPPEKFVPSDWVKARDWQPSVKNYVLYLLFHLNISHVTLFQSCVEELHIFYSINAKCPNLC